jgi:hypothetical protein
MSSVRDFPVLAEDLPEGIADLVQSIGFAAALKLIEHCPGIRIRPPKEDRLHAEHRLVRAIGFEAARKLSRLADGMKIEVPRGATAIRRARNRAMVRDSESMSQPQLALKYKLTQRQVRTILNGFDGDADARQSALF